MENSKGAKVGMNIHILTAPIGSGKSTLLLNWLNSNPQVKASGFISKHDRKMLLERTLVLLPGFTEIPFESELGEVNIGKFKFLKSAFQKALQQIKIKSTVGTVVIDEIGKLELQNQGFEPELSLILQKLDCETLIVVVRSSLLSKVIEKYPIFRNAKINSGPWLPERPKVNGLILGGGSSSRMKTPKFNMNYHGVPQFEHINNLLSRVIDGECFANLPAGYSWNMKQGSLIVDAQPYAGNGPIAGLLTAMDTCCNRAWLVVGVDYPQLSVDQLNELFIAYQVSGRSVCFKNAENDFLEPLVALYSATDLNKLKTFFESGNQSLRHFLCEINCLVLTLSPGEKLTSIDHPEEAEKMLNHLSSP